MANITIGAPAIDRTSIFTPANTSVLVGYPADGSGVINTLEFWLNANSSSIKIGTFYSADQYFTSLTNRDYVTIGSYSAGSKITVTGIEIDVEDGDFIGSYGGQFEGYLSGGNGASYQPGDWFGTTHSYNYDSDSVFSLCGTGETITPDIPTGLTATKNLTDKVTLNWEKVTRATGYKIYRDSSLLATLGDVSTYDDETADAPEEITAGSAVASDGTNPDFVSLSLSGNIAKGTEHSYTIVSTNGSDSEQSSAVVGYRVASLSYQWQRSGGDSDSDYSNIADATTESFVDYNAPAGGIGRYWKCVLSSTGLDDAVSSPDRGYTANELPFAGHVMVSLGELVKMANGKYKLTSASNKEIAVFNEKPTKKIIKEVKEQFKQR